MLFQRVYISSGRHVFSGKSLFWLLRIEFLFLIRTLQKAILFPSVNQVFKQYREKIIEKCRQETLHLAGDGRSDSPGYNAKYGTYTLMNTSTNEILDFYVVHVSTAGNSSRTEKRGLEILLHKIESYNLKINYLTIDRHVQIRAFMKKEKPQTKHQFDIWHVGKNIKKKLFKCSQKKECAELQPWIKSIINHL